MPWPALNTGFRIVLLSFSFIRINPEHYNVDVRKGYVNCKASAQPRYISASSRSWSLPSLHQWIPCALYNPVRAPMLIFLDLSSSITARTISFGQTPSSPFGTLANSFPRHTSAIFSRPNSPNSRLTDPRKVWIGSKNYDSVCLTQWFCLK